MGQTVEFVCVNTLKESWKFREGSLPLNAVKYRHTGSKDSRLEISNVQMDNDGNYTCLGVTEDRKHFEDIGTLIVTGEILCNIWNFCIMQIDNNTFDICYPGVQKQLQD